MKPNKISELIKDYRIKAGITQLELSEKLGYDTPQFVSLFERGVSKVPVETMGKLCVILGIPESKFIMPLMKEYKEKIETKFKSGMKAAGGM